MRGEPLLNPNFLDFKIDSIVWKLTEIEYKNFEENNFKIDSIVWKREKYIYKVLERYKL